MAKNKYTDIDDDLSGQDGWKNKYLSSLKSLEKKEIEWQESERNLRALIAHLTNAADTSSEKLNRQLSVLRNAINEGIEARKLKKAIAEVADSVSSLEAIRGKNKKDASQNLIDLIEQIKPAGKIEKKLHKISNKISKTSKNKEVVPLINEMAKLLVQGLSSAENNSNSGFFSGILNRKKSAFHEEELADEKDITEGDISVEEEPVGTFEKTDAFSERYESEKDGVVNYVAIDLDSAVSSLKTLLEKMILPKGLQLSADQIKQQLNDEVDEKIFLKSLEKTVVIVAAVLIKIKKEKKDIEDFLKQLTGRLQELDSDIRDTARLRELTHRYGVDMASEMQAEMKTMEQGLKDINNIDELKSSVQSRVIMLRNHVDKFLLDEGDKDKQASILIQQLVEKVAKMEKETEELREQLEKEREQTMQDALTGIPNRMAYDERLELSVATFKRHSVPFVLVVWDIDYFKKVNDRYGHSAGDQVLKLVASILNKNMRDIDFLARYGGEEFVSILTVTNIKNAQKITDKLRHIIEESHFHFRDEAVEVTISAGFAEIKKDESAESLFMRADKALYQAKENGRNNCQPAI